MPPERYWNSSSSGDYIYQYNHYDGTFKRYTAKEQVEKIRLDRLLLAISWILDYEPEKPRN
jgi:hypothetical protein